MNSRDLLRNKIGLPAIGAEIFAYLKDVNDRESFTASRRLKDLLTTNLKQELVKVFPSQVIAETSQSTLRKITNSLLSAGSSGNNRTLDAVQELADSSNKAHLEIDYLETTRNLRDWARDYRSAKGALDNNFKCINSVLRVQKTPNDESIKQLLRIQIDGFAEFLAWNSALRDYWIKKELVKKPLQGAYLAIYDSFIRTFEDDLSNVQLHLYLDSIWLRYLSDEHQTSLQTAQFMNSVPDYKEEDKPSQLYEIELEIGEGKIDYLVKCPAFNTFQASQLQFKLALELSKSKQFPSLSFRVAHKKDTFPVIVVAVQGIQSESDVSNIAQFLQNALEKARTTH